MALVLHASRYVLDRSTVVEENLQNLSALHWGESNLRLHEVHRTHHATEILLYIRGDCFWFSRRRFLFILACVFLSRRFRRFIIYVCGTLSSWELELKRIRRLYSNAQEVTR